jgi:hypothetical protein
LRERLGLGLGEEFAIAGQLALASHVLASGFGCPNDGLFEQGCRFVRCTFGATGASPRKISFLYFIHIHFPV